MRYYAIKITGPDGTLVTTPSSVPGSGYTYTSFANDRSLPGALQVELDIPVTAYGQPVGGSYIRIWGISLQEISAATQLNPQKGSDGVTKYNNIAIYGGMKPGLPLATAASQQSGLLIYGAIFQSFGNWVSTEQSLDLIIYPDFGTNFDPKNIKFYWELGTPLEEAIRVTLRDAFPKYTAEISISPKLVLSNSEWGYWNTIEQFANYIKNISRSIIGGKYAGVEISLQDKTIRVSDQSTEKKPILIKFQDMIGQPTWIGGITMQFKCVMRADLAIGDFVKMPASIVTTSAAAASSIVNLTSSFHGAFYVTEIRHVGNFRQPDASCWVTTINAVPFDPLAVKPEPDNVNPQSFEDLADQ